jgi:iron complex outermembrane receptor protein
MPSLSTSLLLMQKLPLALEFSLAGYWQDKMKWSTNSWSPKYQRYDARLGYPFRAGSLRGELAFVVQSLNGAHAEYKASEFSTNGALDDRVVDRREWVTLRLDY